MHAHRIHCAHTHKKLKVKEEELVAFAGKTPQGILVAMEKEHAPIPIDVRNCVRSEEGSRETGADVAEDCAGVVKELVY